MTDEPSEPLPHTDEEWKTRVQTEKGKSPEQPAPRDTAPLPPATLTFLVTTLAMQAMVALGEIPNPLTGKSDVRPDQARHFIDTLGMLEAKTEGNRTPEESAVLKQWLHQLRLAVVTK